MGNVSIMFMDGDIKTYKATDVIVKDGMLMITVDEKHKTLIPLRNVRQVNTEVVEK